MTTRLDDDHLAVLKTILLDNRIDDNWEVSHREGFMVLESKGREFLIDPANPVECGAFLEVVLWDTYNIFQYPEQLSTIVDLGSNIGAFTVLFAEHANRIVAVEAMSPTADYSKLVFERHGIEGQVTLVNAAMSSRSGDTLTLWSRDDGAPITTSSVDPDLAKLDGGTTRFDVPTMSLDDLFRNNQIERCDLLKVDIEAAEFDMFEGACDETLQRVDRITAEIHLVGDIERVERFGRIVARLERLGFSVWAQSPMKDSKPRHVIYMTASRIKGVELRAGRASAI